MSIDYRLTLAGDVSLEDAAHSAASSFDEKSTMSGERMLTANLLDTLGYLISVTSGRDGYYDAENDGSRWEWEPESWVDIDFHMNKWKLEEGRPNMLRAVGRILAGRDEDAALTFNGDHLLLTRFDGVLRRHNPRNWNDEDVECLRQGGYLGPIH